jgi:hypothetical protein
MFPNACGGKFFNGGAERKENVQWTFLARSQAAGEADIRFAWLWFLRGQVRPGNGYGCQGRDRVSDRSGKHARGKLMRCADM